MRGVRVVREQPRGNRERARPDVRFGIRERVAMRMIDVRVEEIGGIAGQRVRHPRDVPDRESAVAAVARASEMSEP